MFCICKTWKRMRQWIFLWQKIVILLENTVSNNMVKGTFWKIFKKIITFQVMEITKIFWGFGQISSFLLLKLLYLANMFQCSATCNKIPRFSTSKYSQIWFNPLVTDCHFWCNIWKLKKSTGIRVWVPGISARSSKFFDSFQHSHLWITLCQTSVIGRVPDQHWYVS